jgi:hypothetical protein
MRAALLAEWSLRYLAPDFFAIHPVEAFSPEEDCLLFDYALLGTVPEATTRVPSFAAWLEKQDHLKAYRHLKQMLQLLDWQRKAAQWLLKTPQHLEHLDSLAAVFLGVRIVWTHRDPLRTLASFCSMQAHGRGLFSDRVDPIDIGRHWSNKAQRMVARAMQARHALGEAPFVDVHYQKLVADPIAQVRRVYDHIERRLEPAVEAEMRSWLARNPQHKHGRHRYELGDFGLQADTLAKRFAPYNERFGIHAETETT